MDSVEGMNKTESIEPRVELARKIADDNPLSDEPGKPDAYRKKVFDCLSSCLTELQKLKGYGDQPNKNQPIDFTMEWADLGNVGQKPLSNEQAGEWFFVSFTEDGYVLVVGAGLGDFHAPSKGSTCWNILDDLDKQIYPEGILISVTGIKPVTGRSGAGAAGCDHLLQCRNGIETYIGECLIQNGFPILNQESHRYNYRGLDFDNGDWENRIREIFSKEDNRWVKRTDAPA